MTGTSSKIGILGGTFDPIHFGHLNLAMEILEARHLDQVLFCPAALSPFKQQTPPSFSNEDRCRMIALAIEEIPCFSLCDAEIRRPQPSYSIDTVRFLLKEEEGKQFYWILGEDALADFSLWKEVETLVQLAPPLIGARHGKAVSPFSGSALLMDAVTRGMTKIPMMDISSSRVRSRLIQEKCCEHLVPAKALDYIYHNRLYS